MKTLADINTPKLLLLLQSCHSILGAAWPRPGYPQLAGARAFIGTNLFSALENASMELDRLVADLDSTGMRGDLVILWRRSSDVIKRLKSLGRSSNNPQIDAAFNLLYLSTGILYQELAHTLLEAPKQDARFSTVEEIEELIKKCEWKGGDKEITRQIDESLLQVLEAL